ncbi:MAG: hypothetical protein KF846_04745 [Cyclobacteriaceae bacterium]|nr:hypothetical protein [Cyclobacteriaceae bacterium]
MYNELAFYSDNHRLGSYNTEAQSAFSLDGLSSHTNDDNLGFIGPLVDSVSNIFSSRNQKKAAEANAKSAQAQLQIANTQAAMQQQALQQQQAAQSQQMKMLMIVGGIILLALFIWMITRKK